MNTFHPQGRDIIGILWGLHWDIVAVFCLSETGNKSSLNSILGRSSVTTPENVSENQSDELMSQTGNQQMPD